MTQSVDSQMVAADQATDRAESSPVVSLYGDGVATRVNGTWNIVTKVIAHTRGEMPEG